jgi:hypothetical protein
MNAIGQYLASGDLIFSEWFTRQGDNCYIYVEVIDGSGELTVTAFHKDPEETTNYDGVTTGSSVVISGVGQDKLTPTSLLELVRLKFSVASAGVRFRVIGISWYNNAN